MTDTQSALEVEAQQQFQALEPKVMTYIESIQSIVITTADEYSYADDVLVEIKTKKKRIAEAFSPTKKSAKATHNAICTLENKATQHLDTTEVIIKRKMTDYIKEQRAEEADRQRLANEEAKLIAASQAEKRGKPEQADEILDGKVAIPTAVIQTDIPKGNSSIRTKWKYRVTNEAAINIKFLMPNDEKIGKIVTALGEDAVDAVGGIEVYEDISLATRTK